MLNGTHFIVVIETFKQFGAETICFLIELLLGEE